MTITEYIQRLDTFRKNLPQRIFAKVAAYAGETIRAQVETRARHHQTNAKGSFYSIYSPKYLKYREKKGRHNLHKSFEFTGIMWGKWGVKNDQSKIFDDGFLVRMGGTTPKSQMLINVHSEREIEKGSGVSIIDMSSDEQKKLNLWVDKWVFEFAKESGL